MFVLKVYLVISSRCLLQNFVTRWTYGSARGGGPHLQFQIEECSSAGHISYYYAASALGIEVKFSSLHFCHKVRMLVRHLPRTFYCKVIILAGQTGNLLGLKMANFA